MITQPIADVVITVLPHIGTILIDMSVGKSKAIEEMFNSFDARRYGINVGSSAEQNGYKVLYTRVWKGSDLAKEIKDRLINEAQNNLTILCQIEEEDGKVISLSK
jgi:hypothetical protein